MGTACFTGHRTVPMKNESARRLYEILDHWISAEGIMDFYAGGALGWDTIAANTVLKLREIYPHIKLHLILPCSAEEQTAKWNSIQKREYYRIMELADSVEFVSEHYYTGCMKARNQRLVDKADTCCFCYWDSSNFASGTGQTVRLAKKKQLTVINLRDDL